MRPSCRKVAIFAMLLVLVFPAAQIHFCTDLASAPSHLCPVCATADSVAPTAPIEDTGLVLSHRVAVPARPQSVSILLPSGISPRAPPAL
jgi:hypothetical protein